MRERIGEYLRRCYHAVRIKSGVWGSGAGLILAGAAMLTVPLTEALGWASIGVGTGLFLWGVRLHGMHLWQTWWRGKPSPFRVTAGIHKFDYARGSVVAGIPWEQGFSHVFVKLTNESPNAVENVDVLFAPEHPIIRSSARCDFAECRIGSLHNQPQVTILLDLPGGQKVAEAHDWSQPGNYSIEPSHRLHCDRLPSRAEIDIDLATVVPEIPPSATGPWKRTRSDPTGIRVRITWAEADCIYGAEQLLELKGVDHEKRP